MARTSIFPPDVIAWEEPDKEGRIFLRPTRGMEIMNTQAFVFQGTKPKCKKWGFMITSGIISGGYESEEAVKAGLLTMLRRTLLLHE